MALALEAIEMTGDFDIDVLEEESDALLAFAEKGNNPDQIKASSTMVRNGSLPRHYRKIATNWPPIWPTAFRRLSTIEGFCKKAMEQRDWVRDYCRRQAQRQQAEAKLKTNPNDADAHLLLGRCYCLGDDWKKGLPHLAKGGDAQLRQLAEQDLAAPRESAAQIKLADAWWTLGKAHQGEEADALLLRAGYWYDRAHATPTSGFNRLKAEKRLEEIVEIRHSPRRPSPPPGRELAASAPKPLERSILSQKLRWQY